MIESEYLWTDGHFGGFNFAGASIIEENYPKYDEIQKFADKFGVDDGEMWESFWKKYNAQRGKALKKAIQDHWHTQTNE
jgi:hypothetical protein